MTQEEKAKAYDEAIKLARDYYKANLKLDRVDENLVLEDIFPELKESEDEKIRKALIRFHKSTIDIDGIKGDRIIAWLEKQDNKSVNIDIESMVSSYEQRLKSQAGSIENSPLVNMCITSFRHGIENTLDAMKLKGLEKQGEQKSFDYENANIQQKDFAPKVESKFKDGNWIVSNEKLYVYQIEEINEFVVKVREINGETFVVNVNCLNDAHLWTIQDAKDGDVLQLGVVTVIFQEYIGNGNCKCYYSVYNGEFEIPTKDESYGTFNATPATKEQRNLLFQKMKEAGYEWDAENKQLNKISQRMISAEAKEAMYSNPAWSEEDEYRTEKLLGWINTLINYIHEDAMVSLDLRMERIQQVEQIKTWLKSLRPQNAWKPSDKQMAALSDINCTGCISYAGQGQELINLYNDLKKLKG